MKAFIYTLMAAGLLSVPALAGMDIAVQDLPKEVTAAIEKQYPGAKLIKAEEEKKLDGHHYEVTIHHNNQKRELNVLPDGKILKDELDD